MPFLFARIQYRGEDCAEITGFTGEVRILVIPETIGGLVVRSIGKHAFAARKDLQEVILPRSLRRLSLFAFHNCSGLRKMSLYDGVDDYYDGVIRQCSSLEEIELTADGSSYALMKEMLEDNDRAMSFRLRLPEEEIRLSFPDYALIASENTEEIRLSFPDYALIASENTMARTIQFAYEGGGYAYRQCIRKKEIRFREYDRLFPFMEHDDPSFAAVIASDRLMFPHDLDAAAEERYLTFLRTHAAEALDRFIRESQIERVRLVAERGLADADALSQALVTASERKETAICAVLMESGRQTNKKQQELTLELEDW